MQFSDTSNKSGLIQECEFWTGLGDGVISSDPTLLKQFTSRLNRAFDSVMPLILSKDDTLQWDDPNHTKESIGRTNLVSGQQAYAALADEQGNSVLNVVKAFVLQSAAATDFTELRRVPVGDGRAMRILNPSASFTGIPSEYVERGGFVFLGAIPDYDAELGLKLMFERAQLYFVSSDTTKTAGIPSPFQPLLPLHASKAWLSVNKPENRLLIGEIKEEIAQIRKDLQEQNAARFPKRKHISGVRARAV